jgi:hypothetical protein
MNKKELSEIVQKAVESAFFPMCINSAERHITMITNAIWEKIDKKWCPLKWTPIITQKPVFSDEMLLFMFDGDSTKVTTGFVNRDGEMHPLFRGLGWGHITHWTTIDESYHRNDNVDEKKIDIIDPNNPKNWRGGEYILKCNTCGEYFLGYNSDALCKECYDNANKKIQTLKKHRIFRF